MSRTNSLSAEQLTDSAYYILLSLLSPRHGYAIMKYIEELTDGEVAMGPATLYTLIKKLQESEYIELYEPEDERRKTYIVSAKGRAIISAEIERRLRMARYGLKALDSAKDASKNNEK